MTQVGSNDGEFCGDGLEPHKDRRSRWVLLVRVICIYLKLAKKHRLCC